MKTSDIKLEEFNNCPEAGAVKHYLYTYNIRPYIRMVDLDHSRLKFHVNSGDTLVLAIVKGKTEMNIALALGKMAVWFKADEFTWEVIDGTYVVRLWWD